MLSDHGVIVAIPTPVAPNRANIQAGVNTVDMKAVKGRGGSLPPFAYDYIYNENGDRCYTANYLVTSSW